MPIYEYRCKQCEGEFEKYVAGTSTAVACPSCASEQVMRKLSVGASVRLNVYREGQQREVVYTLPERPLLPSDVSEGRTLSPIGGRGHRPRLR